MNAGANGNFIGTNGSSDSFNANERNVISGNLHSGIYLTDSGTNANRIAGNYIGVAAAGNAALANSHSGVVFINGASLNVVGTNGDGIADAIERNVISGNISNGVQVEGAATTANTIAGNYIGTNAAGTAAIANNNHGVVVFGGASNTVVGTDGDGVGDEYEGNLVSGNTYDGVSTWIGAAPQLVVAETKLVRMPRALGQSRMEDMEYG